MRSRIHDRFLSEIRKSLVVSLQSLAILGALSVSTTSAAPVGSTVIVAMKGDPSPDGRGEFAGLGDPSLNDKGEVVFFAAMTGASGGINDGGAYRGDGTTLTQIARTGDTAPDGNGTYLGISSVGINEAGEVVFRAAIEGAVGAASSDQGVFRGDGMTVTQVVRNGQPGPNDDGTFHIDGALPNFNDSGQVVLQGRVAGVSGDPPNYDGLFRADGEALVPIAVDGQPGPDGNGVFSVFSLPRVPSLNESGQAAFVATLFGIDGDSSFVAGVFRGDGAEVTQIALAGQTAPDGNGAIVAFSISPALNNAGQVAFKSRLVDTADGLADGFGIFRSDGTTTTQIARAGQSAPDGNGTIGNFFEPSINDFGEVAFVGSVEDAIGGSGYGDAVFLGDGTKLVQIAREGQAAPDGNGSFGAFGYDRETVTLNDAGEIAFYSTLFGTAGGSSDNRGIFYYDEKHGLLQIARTGDLFLGGTITDVYMAQGTVARPRDDEWNGFNNRGQIAYSFSLDDGRSGVAIWTIPEPSSLAIAGLAGLFATALVRRRYFRGEPVAQ